MRCTLCPSTVRLVMWSNSERPPGGRSVAAPSGHDAHSSIAAIRLRDARRIMLRACPASTRCGRALLRSGPAVFLHRAALLEAGPVAFGDFLVVEHEVQRERAIDVGAAQVEPRPHHADLVAN